VLEIPSFHFSSHLIAIRRIWNGDFKVTPGEPHAGRRASQKPQAILTPKVTVCLSTHPFPWDRRRRQSRSFASSATNPLASVAQHAFDLRQVGSVWGSNNQRAARLDGDRQRTAIRPAKTIPLYFSTKTDFVLASVNYA
jgi:hypothetical protein